MQATRDPGLRLIIGYKVVKGSLALTTAAALLVALLTGRAPAIESWATHVAHHMTGAWMLHAAHLLERIAEPDALRMATVLVAVDGCSTLFEGWALHHGKAWGEWLVVAATASFLPFEVLAIVRGLHLWRVGVLVVNVAIVVYLARHVLRRRAITERAALARRSLLGDRAAPSHPHVPPLPR